MTVPTVEAAVGGQYSGSGASPGGTAANGLTALAGDIILVLCYTSRSLAAGTFDFHEVSSITSTGLTFTKIIDENYQYQEASGSFPAASCHVDAFVAVVGSDITQQTWSGVMAAAGDTFVNDGWGVAITIRGADTSTILDTYSGNPVTETNVSLSASAASVTTDIIASESILFFLAFMHTVGAQATVTVPTGFTVPGTGDGTHFKTTAGGGSATATKVDGLACYKTYAAPQSALNVVTGSTDNCWFGATIAIRSADAIVPNTKRSVGVVIQ